jgi:phage repressor protein C with HTH and peptisase S24 domain
MDKFEQRRQALLALRAQLGHGAISQIASRIDVDPSYVSRMLYPEGKAGQKRIGEDNVERLNAAFPGWLEAETGELATAVSSAPPPGYVRLEHLSPTPSMGRGRELDAPVQLVQHLDVLEQWVREKVGSVNPSRIKVLTGSGNSMSPTINDGDLVFVDVECRSIEAAGIYVLDVAGRLILKKAMILSSGTLIIRSDNIDEYPDEERYDLRHIAEAITVCGKVMAWWSLRKG